jgi:hypothetical protein
MTSGDMIYVPSFTEISSDVQKLLEGDAHAATATDTHTQQGDLFSLLLFSQNKESRLKYFLIKYF